MSSVADGFMRQIWTACLELLHTVFTLIDKLGMSTLLGPGVTELCGSRC
jgi:hypothetical protein